MNKLVSILKYYFLLCERQEDFIYPKFQLLKRTFLGHKMALIISKRLTKKGKSK
jgi:hypothetical protein